MKFFAPKKLESADSVKTKIFSISEISTLDSSIQKTLPYNVKELGNLVSPLCAQGLVISSTLVQDFWTNNNLDKKIKKIITPLSLHHPRAITSAAQTIQRLISRQNVPDSWQLKKKNKAAEVTVYLGNSEIGSSDWLPKLRTNGSDDLSKVIKQGLSAVYSERFIRQRLQRGWSQHHLPLTIVATQVEELKNTDPVLTVRTVHPGYHNSSIAELNILIKGESYDYTIFKPAFGTKKAIIINHWNNPIISEEVLRTMLAPIMALEQKIGRSIQVSGIFNHTQTALTITHLEIDQAKDKESLYEYVLSGTSSVLGSGEFFGQGIAVGSVLVERPGQALKIPHSGHIIVTKNLSTISQAAAMEAAGFILEEDPDTARISAKTRHILVPIIAGVKNAMKKFRSGTMVTMAVTTLPEGAVYSGALPYEVKPLIQVKHNIKTEVRPTRASVTIDELIGQSQARHPLDYFSKKKNNGKVYTELLGQALALAVAEQYPARLTVAFSNSLPRVFTHWPGGKQAENSLRLRSNARGAERYLAKQYEPVLAAECAALIQARERFGFTGIDIQLPYCRSSVELEEMIAVLGKHGLTREKGWRFSLATDLPGHAILTSALAKHLDELVFNIDSLVKSTTGTRSTTITPTHQKTVEHALSAIAKAARKERTRVALSGTLLATQPRLVWSAVKSGIKTLVVTQEEESVVRTAAWEAERSVGFGGTSPQFLSSMAGVACLGAFIIMVGAGCGRQDQTMTAPQMTPAQIRAEIMTALAEEKEKSLNEKTTATVSGFADFKVEHPRRYEATFSPDSFVLSNKTDGQTLKFSALNKFGTTSSTDFMTNSGLQGKLFSFPVDEDETTVTDLIPLYVYEIELGKNKILKIQTTSDSEVIMGIVKSIQSI